MNINLLCSDCVQPSGHNFFFPGLCVDPETGTITDNFDASKNLQGDSKMTSLAVVPYDEAKIPLHEKSVRHFNIAGHNFSIQQDYLGLGVSAMVWDSVSMCGCICI